MTGKGTIVVTEHGATVTVCINRAFAERLIEYINTIPEKQKPEGDNQVLAGMFDQALRKATATPKKIGPRKMPRWRMRYELKRSRSAAAFWQRLLEDVAANDGAAIATINERIARQEAAIVEYVAALEEGATDDR